MSYNIWIGDTDFDITYNYSEYYYDVMKDGIRCIYGMTGMESVPILCYMIDSIKEKYCPNGEWKKSERTQLVYTSPDGEILSFNYIINHLDEFDSFISQEIYYEVDEGDASNYWEETAANAIEALTELIEAARAYPEDVWEGD